MNRTSASVECSPAGTPCTPTLERVLDDVRFWIGLADEARTLLESKLSAIYGPQCADERKSQPIPASGAFVDTMQLLAEELSELLRGNASLSRQLNARL